MFNPTVSTPVLPWRIGNCLWLMIIIYMDKVLDLNLYWWPQIWYLVIFLFCFWWVNWIAKRPTGDLSCASPSVMPTLWGTRSKACLGDCSPTHPGKMLCVTQRRDSNLGCFQQRLKLLFPPSPPCNGGNVWIITCVCSALALLRGDYRGAGGWALTAPANTHCLMHKQAGTSAELVAQW